MESFSLAKVGLTVHQSYGSVTHSIVNESRSMFRTVCALNQFSFCRSDELQCPAVVGGSSSMLQHSPSTVPTPQICSGFGWWAVMWQNKQWCVVFAQWLSFILLCARESCGLKPGETSLVAQSASLIQLLSYPLLCLLLAENKSKCIDKLQDLIILARRVILAPFT